jgi:rRNA-processing protein FCF1
MSEIINQLIVRYKQAGIMVDTNILLLYFVGAFDPNLIPRFKRTLQFAVEDHATLIRILRLFDKVVTTPNILTEVNSLSGQLGEPIKSQYFEKFSSGITLLGEECVASREVAQMQEFVRFGLTDTGIIYLTRGKYLVLTDDFRLSQYLQSAGVDVLNFNHIRIAGW